MVVIVFGEGADGDGSDVAFVDRGSGHVEIGPANNVASADLRRPPVERVGGEHSWTEKGPLPSRGFDLTLDVFGERTQGIVLLEEGVRSCEGSREEDDAAHAGEDSVESRGDAGGRSGPDKKNRVDAGEAGLERVRNGEIAAD